MNNHVEQVVTVLQNLVEIVKNKPTPKQVYVMAELLSQDMTIEQIKGVVQIAMRTLQWWPTPSEMYKILRDSNGVSWDTEWSKVLAEVSSRGIYQGMSKQISDDTRRAVEAIGGFNAICNATNEMMPTLAAQFRLAFSNISGRSDVNDWMFKYLPEGRAGGKYLSRASKDLLIKEFIGDQENKDSQNTNDDLI